MPTRFATTATSSAATDAQPKARTIANSFGSPGSRVRPLRRSSNQSTATSVSDPIASRCIRIMSGTPTNRNPSWWSRYSAVTMYGHGPSTAYTLRGSSRSTGTSASSKAAWWRMIGACGSKNSTPTSTTTSHEEIGRSRTCADDFSSGSSDTSFRLRRLSHMKSGSSSNAATRSTSSLVL